VPTSEKHGSDADTGEGAGAARTKINPCDDVFLRMVELSLEPRDDYRWGKLIDEAEDVPLQAYEIVELIEGRARNAARRNDFAHAHRILVEALDLAQKSAPHVADRVGRSLRDLQVVHGASEQAS